MQFIPRFDYNHTYILHKDTLQRRGGEEGLECSGRRNCNYDVVILTLEKNKLRVLEWRMLIEDGSV